ncbi:MAG TPA: sigma-70 family RNA polymerase sigma factor [Acidimicrobiales bacterium]|nr:sigma-70 family RNA polymerase sigma factor [Acidimicrobiales bacterium]
MAQRLAAGPEGTPAWGTCGDALLRHRDEVHAVVRRVLFDAGAAEDVVQETLLRALRHEATVERERAGAWLTVVGRRLAVDTSRARQRVEVVAEHDDTPSPERDPAELAEQRHLLDQVAEALDGLSPRQRRLLMRQVDAGLSLAQLAEEERTTVASVRSVLNRAREALRSNLHHSGWLVAGLLPRVLTAVRSPADRLLARIDRSVPLLPHARNDAAEVLTAGAAAVALFFSTFAGSGDSGRHDPADVALPAPSPQATVAAPVEPQVPAPLAGLEVGLPALSLDGDLSEAFWWEMPPEREHVPIPFQDFGGDVTHFAVSPDQRTVIASGGWVETAPSARGETLAREWTPLFYRSDDGGHSWERREVPGFLPGRVLFAPQWPDDPRIFVVTDDKSVLQSEDGGRTFVLLQQLGTTQPPPVRPEEPAHTLGWVPRQLPDPGEDPRTTIKQQQHVPPTPPLRPAVLSDRFDDGEELLYIGGEGAGVFHVRLGVLEPLVSTPPWQVTNGIAPAPDHAETGAILVGAVEHSTDSSGRGAVYRCLKLRCTQVRAFEDMGNAPGLFVSPADPRLVYAWTPYTAYRSSDGGLTWGHQVLGPVLDVVEVGRRLVFVSMSGVPVSDDRGVTWRRLHTVQSIWAAASVGHRHLVAASGPGTACSPDAGDRWLPTCPSR